MARETFVLKEVGDFFNKNFINIKVECFKDPVGKKIGKKYEVKGYPTLDWVDGNGKKIYRTMGVKNKTTLIEEAKKALKTWKK